METRLVFDLDGTLVDTTAEIHDALVYAFRAMDRRPPPNLAEEWIGPPWEETAPRYWDEYEAARFIGHYRDYYERIFRHSPLFPGVAAVLRELPWVGVATNKPTREARLVVAHHGLRVDRLAGAEPGTKPKPDPELLHRVGGGTHYVGDTVRDMLAARAAGMVPVGVAWGIDSPAQLLAAGAARVLESIEEVRRLL